MSKTKATIDFETRSRANLPKVGQWRYAQDASTQVICLSYKLPGMSRPKTWIPKWLEDEYGVKATPEPTDLFEWIANGGEVEAHNAMFERAIWRMVMVGQYFWPDIPNRQWRCSAAKAASFSLPRSLDKAGEVMKAKVGKDKEGHKLMMRLCKPRKPTKNDPSEWHGSREEFLRLIAYCETDVLAEESFSDMLPDLPEFEQELWQIDQEINEYGVPIDVTFVEKAIQDLDQLRASYTEELNRITNGQVPKPTARKQLLEWLTFYGLELDNTKAETLDALLENPDDLPENILRVISLVRMAGRSSTSKYKAIMARLTSENRVRDVLVYAGASRTSRWAGSGIQPQNLPRGNIKDMDEEIAKLMSFDMDDLLEEYDDIFEVFASALRGAIVPAPGFQMVSADYNAIEARGLFWVCDHQKGLDIFRDKSRDIYLDMAEDIFSKPKGSLNKKEHGKERQVGKVGILGCGYGLGKNKMVDYGNKAFTSAKVDLVMDVQFAERVVNSYRTTHKPVVDFWYQCENAAIDAMLNPGTVVRVNKHIAYKRANRFLFCQLPSGRLIPYPYPQLQKITTPWGAEKWQLTYEEVNGFTKKWSRSHTYGGKLVENIVQALCRDLMGYAMHVVRHDGRFRILLTVHDELVTQTHINRPNAAPILEELMCRLPAWADGFPITAEGWAGERYRK